MTLNNTLDISHIAGNASDDIKQAIGNPHAFLTGYSNKSHSPSLFGESIQKRLKVTEISINKKVEEEKKTEARVVVELEVCEGRNLSLCYSDHRF